MMKFKVGDKVLIIGRPEWKSYGWSSWIKLVGKTAIVKGVKYNTITIYVDGQRFGLYPKSLSLCVKPNEQLLFEFMYDKT